MTDTDKTRDLWLAEQLDCYVRALRSSFKEAEEFLSSQTDKELIELCETFKSARESAQRGFAKLPPRNSTLSEAPLLLMILFAVVMLLYAGIEMASLKRENRDLRKQVWELVGEKIENENAIRQKATE